MKQLQVLELNDNRIHGRIMNDFYTLNKLKLLDLSNNLLEGEISKNIGNFTQLQDLQIFTNFFTGSVPSEIGQLSQLRTLLIQNTSLTGTIPTSICNIPTLTVLLSDCASPPIPPQISCQCCTLCFSDYYYEIVSDNAQQLDIEQVSIYSNTAYYNSELIKYNGNPLGRITEYRDGKGTKNMKSDQNNNFNYQQYMLYHNSLENQKVAKSYKRDYLGY